MKEPAVWGLHINHVRGDTPIDLGYIAIGWHELGDVSKIKATRQAFKEAYLAAIPGSKPGTIPVSAGQIFRFVHEMQIGDIVVYPSRHDRLVNIGRVTGPYEYVLDADGEYPHRRATEWLRRVGRDEFSQNALYEIGAAMTLFRVTSYAEEFLSALTGQIVAQPAVVD
jgi:restriction system protein